MEDLLECPKCLLVPGDSVYVICKNGHSICGKCQKEVPNCPNGGCSYDVPPRRNLALEAVLAKEEANKIRFKCVHAREGCDVLTPKDKLSDHQKNCQLRMVTCPDSRCKRELKFREMRNHLDLKHLVDW